MRMKRLGGLKEEEEENPVLVAPSGSRACQDFSTLSWKRNWRAKTDLQTSSRGQEEKQMSSRITIRKCGQILFPVPVALLIFISASAFSMLCVPTTLSVALGWPYNKTLCLHGCLMRGVRDDWLPHTILLRQLQPIWPSLKI